MTDQKDYHYAIVDLGKETENVVNVIVWDGDMVNNPYNPGKGFDVIKSDIACIGWTYASGVFTPPPPVPDQQTGA